MPSERRWVWAVYRDDGEQIGRWHESISEAQAPIERGVYDATEYRVHGLFTTASFD